MSNLNYICTGIPVSIGWQSSTYTVVDSATYVEVCAEAILNTTGLAEVADSLGGRVIGIEVSSSSSGNYIIALTIIYSHY